MVAYTKILALALVTLAMTSDLVQARKPLPFVGEIRWMSFQFAPEGWLVCDGSEHKASDFEQLAKVLGNKFGGDGKKTFHVPSLMETVGEGAQGKDVPKLYPVISYSGVYPVRHYT